ncbi:MAG: chemotaxis protein CheD [Candidatus Omnitrophica bacterium]|nr:chemotaxis protein CheD [Candidatus Omnitrophota bacterium]
MSYFKGEKIIVPMAGLAVAEAPQILSTLALGSCMGIILYDRYAKIGGLAHCMLPNSKTATHEYTPGKYVDTAIEELIAKLEKKGVKSKSLSAVLVGGADMFPHISHKLGLNIGEGNLEAARRELGKRHIKIEKEDTGGSIGRTVEFDLQTGKLMIRDSKGQIKFL